MDENAILRIIEEGKIGIKVSNSDEAFVLLSLFIRERITVFGWKGYMQLSDYADARYFWRWPGLSRGRPVVECKKSLTDLPDGISGFINLSTLRGRPDFIY